MRLLNNQHHWLALLHKITLPIRRWIVKSVVIFLLCAVISACADLSTTEISSFTVSSTPPINKKYTDTPQIPTITPVTAKSSPIINFTVHPTYTPTLTQTTNTVPIDAEATLTIQAVERRNRQIASFPTLCEGSTSNYISISPNGNWLAASCNSKYGRTLEILGHKGRQWNLQFKDYLSKEFIRNGDAPEGGLYPIQWINEDYLFFTSVIAFDGGGTCFYGFGVQGLYRIDLRDGWVSATLPPLSSSDGYLIAFSPGGRWLAYSAGSPAILDLKTGENTPLKNDDQFVGDFTWSPDGSELAYATCVQTKDHMAEERSRIIIYNRKSHISKIILEAQSRLLGIEYWDENGILKISNENYQVQYDVTNYSYYHSSSEQYITPTVAPTP